MHRHAIKEDPAMGMVRDHSVTIACIGAGSAIIAAFAKPICEALLPDTPELPQTVAAAPAEPGATPAPVTPTPGGIEGAGSSTSSRTTRAPSISAHSSSPGPKTNT
jgi:hypothetical protein